MYFTDRSLLPENQPPLIITAAPYGPSSIPSDFPEDIPVTWDEQVQKAIDCFEAGARILHIHVRDPETGKISKTSTNTQIRSAAARSGARHGAATRRLDLVSPEGDDVANGKAMTPGTCWPRSTRNPTGDRGDRLVAV